MNPPPRWKRRNTRGYIAAPSRRQLGAGGAASEARAPAVRELLLALCLCSARYVYVSPAAVRDGAVYCENCAPPPPPPPPPVCDLCAGQHHALDCRLSVGLRRRPPRRPG